MVIILTVIIREVWRMLCSRFKRYTNHVVTGQCCSDTNSPENRTAKTSKGRFEGPFCSSQTTEGAVQK